MTPIDIAVLVVAFLYAVSGFRRGFLVGAFGVVGLLVGGAIGIAIVPPILSRFQPGFWVSLAAVAIVLVAAGLGNEGGSAIGFFVRDRVTWRPARFVDSVAGGALGAAAALVVLWVVGVALSGVPVPWLARGVNQSVVLGTVDEVMPGLASRAFAEYDRVVDPSVFPRFLDPFTREPIETVAPPSPGVVSDPDVVRAANSVVKVTGLARSCASDLEGSGFVVAPQRVMTNAHVVAGVRRPVVHTDDGRSYPATVVEYDPDVDVAVLAVPDLGLPALPLSSAVRSDADGAVVGYPGNGPLTTVPARVRGEQQLIGPNIYASRTVHRDVLTLYTTVRPGNSGGPLISPAGAVWGVVFAASVEHPNAGYALATGEVAGAAHRAESAQAPVSTGACAM